MRKKKQETQKKRISEQENAERKLTWSKKHSNDRNINLSIESSKTAGRNGEACVISTLISMLSGNGSCATKLNVIAVAESRRRHLMCKRFLCFGRRQNMIGRPMLLAHRASTQQPRHNVICRFRVCVSVVFSLSLVACHCTSFNLNWLSLGDGGCNFFRSACVFFCCFYRFLRKSRIETYDGAYVIENACGGECVHHKRPPQQQQQPQYINE